MSSAALAERKPRSKAEFVPVIFMALLGIVLITNAVTLGNNSTGVDPLGPRPVPMAIGAVSIVLAIALLVTTLRGERSEAEEGEDVDLEHGTDFKTVAMLIGAFVLNIALIDILGWVISGALLFYGSAIALGNRHYIRDLFIAAAMSLVTFYGFAIGLGVNLPAGILQGIL